MGHFNDDRSSTNLNKEEEEDIISLADELLEDSSTHEEYAAGWPDFMDFHGLSVDEQVDYSSNNHSHNNPHDELIISSMKQDDDEDDERNMCLNLRLNYEQVLEAWPHRTPIWAAAAADDDAYEGEVAMAMEEEEERRRREARVIRYREKRQSRLFSNKIRYQVRKMNADKRPRLKVIIIIYIIRLGVGQSGRNFMGEGFCFLILLNNFSCISSKGQ
ncbi:hypothetical protein M9H77_00986 [Catharanthus roseus]|uniref:Uncharacterized protein n=1 Tax=Catharanthus roseus TaxID=4058 RepID=A0ACC0C4A0_CATRO|nr:hypothetical protein M9H77_00986 [Catharanthus roseus]